MEELRLQAPAKINLHLQVLNKRQDGFHNISSLFTLIDLCDTLSFKKNKKDIELIESVPFENNIVLKAANLIKEYSKFFHHLILRQVHKLNKPYKLNIYQNN